MSRIIAARVDDDLAAGLEQLVQQAGRGRSALNAQALRSYVVTERDFLAKVGAGLADLEAARLTDYATVTAAIRLMCRSVP